MSRPQFAPRTHRARDTMQEWAATQAPDIWQRIETARLDWPAHDPHIYLPYSAAIRAVPRHGSDLSQWSQDCALAAGWGAWRTTQGIYRFDPALYAALIDTPMDRIPVAVLDHLPEWAVYIETPDWCPALTRGRRVHGVLAWRQRIMEDEVDVLQLVLLAGRDADGVDYDREVLTLPLVDTVDGAIAKRIADAEESAQLLGVPRVSDSEASALRSALPRILSLLLYLCSEAPDLTRRGKPDVPANPTPVRTRRHGWRLFPADGPREWDVGVRLGAALRAAYAREETGQGDGHDRPRGHVRRAHWHTYRIGEGRAQRKLRWLPPIAVNLAIGADLPATIRRVGP